jgi:hypothetical protein
MPVPRPGHGMQSRALACDLGKYRALVYLTALIAKRRYPMIAGR